LRRRGAIIGGALAAIVLIGALVAYLVVAPGVLAGNYGDDAKPQHDKVRQAMEGVYPTFDSNTFGSSDKSVHRAKTPTQYVRALRRVTAKERADLQPAADALSDARKVMREMREDDLAEVPSWPALDGRGKLADADAIAADERRYVRESRSFLREYGRLIDYTRDDLDYAKRAGVILGTGFDNLPKNPGSPEAIAKPVDAIAADLARLRRAYQRRTKPPRDLRAEKRRGVALIDYTVRSLHGLTAAIRRRDLPAIKRFDKEFARGARQYRVGSRASLRKLLTDSRLSGRMHRLRRLEDELGRRLAKL
jgi:hypothetical protein